MSTDPRNTIFLPGYGPASRVTHGNVYAYINGQEVQLCIEGRDQPPAERPYLTISAGK